MKARDLWVTLLPVLIVLAICGMAMHVTGKDNTCTDAGGRLEFAVTWSTVQCVRDGQVIEP